MKLVFFSSSPLTHPPLLTHPIRVPLTLQIIQDQFALPQYPWMCGSWLVWSGDMALESSVFLFTSSRQSPVAPWLAVGCVYASSPCWDLVWLGLAQVCGCCHSHPESLWAAALLRFPCVHLLPPLLVASHPGLYTMISEPWEVGYSIDVLFSCSVFLPKTAALWQRRQCCHCKKVSGEEREKETQLLYDFYTLSGFRLTCVLVTGMEVDHVFRGCTCLCFLVMVLLLPPLLDEAFRMTHVSFPHADPWSILAAADCGLAVPLFIVLFPAGRGIGLSAKSPTSFVRFLETLCFAPHSCVYVSLGKHWHGRILEIFCMANQAGSSACQEGSVITDMRYSKCWSW